MRLKNTNAQDVNTKKNPFDQDAKKHYERARRFFLSEYFFNLTNLDGKAVLNKLDAETGGEINKPLSVSD